MIHAIKQGKIQWHCAHPACSYHNCAAWDRVAACAQHPQTQWQQPPGNTHETPVSELTWADAQHIVLPRCQECGTVMTVRVFREEECLAPTITRDEHTGKIVQVKADGVAPWIVDTQTHHLFVPHPTLAHLSHEQIRAMMASIQAQAPHAPIDWMLSTSIYEEIKDVFPHPAIALHQEAARLLVAAGKIPLKAPEGGPH